MRKYIFCFVIPALFILFSCGKPSPITMVDIHVPQEGLVFPVGSGDNGHARIDRSYALGQSEMTNAVARDILQWAFDNGRFSTVSGSSNYLSPSEVKIGGQDLLLFNDYKSCRIHYYNELFTVEEGYNDYPLEMVSIFGAMMLCNWLTEMEMDSDEQVVYSGIDDDWTTSEVRIDLNKTGFRLPTSDEWHCAARWEGQNSGFRKDLVSRGANKGDEELTPGYYWNPGTYASGAKADYMFEKETSRVAVYYENLSGAYPDGPMPVGSKKRNALGLYDMSGNVREWCYHSRASAPGMQVVFLGGSWSSLGQYIQSGGMYYVHNPWYEYEDISFRLCQTLPAN